MIFGIGVDIVEINRIEKIFDKFNESFLTRNYHPLEMKIYNQIKLRQDKIAYLAKRFAAKEAFAKAVGSGIGRDDICFKDIATLNDEYGKPYIVQNIIKDKEIHISLSDEALFAIAFVTIV